MRRAAALVVLAAACSTESVPISPDETSSATTGVSSASASSGAGGSGGSSSSSSASTAASSGSGAASMQGNGYESGSRLRARYYSGDDGSQQFFGWRDTMLDTNCYALHLTDGTVRCAPEIVGGVGVAFSDAACTQWAATIATSSCPITAPKYVVGGGGQACTTSYRVYQLGAKIQPTPTTLYYLNASSVCTATSASGVDVYAATEQPPSTFVKMSEMVE